MPIRYISHTTHKQTDTHTHTKNGPVAKHPSNSEMIVARFVAFFGPGGRLDRIRRNRVGGCCLNNKGREREGHRGRVFELEKG